MSTFSVSASFFPFSVLFSFISVSQICLCQILYYIAISISYRAGGPAGEAEDAADPEGGSARPLRITALIIPGLIDMTKVLNCYT